MGHRRHRQHRPGAVPARPARGRRRPGRPGRQPRPGQGRGLRDRPWHRPGDRRLRRARRVARHRRRLRGAPQRPARRTDHPGAAGQARRCCARSRSASAPPRPRTCSTSPPPPPRRCGRRSSSPSRPSTSGSRASSRTGRSASRPSSTAPSTSCSPTRPTSGWTPRSAAARWPTSAATPSASRSSSSARDGAARAQARPARRITENGVDTDAAGIVTFGRPDRLLLTCGFKRSFDTFTSVLGSAGQIQLTNPFHPSPADTLTISRPNADPVTERPTTDNRSFTAAIRHIHAVLRGEEAPAHTAAELLAARRPRAGRAAATHRDIARQDLTIRE